MRLAHVLDEAVAVVHGAAVAGLITGGLLALRRPRWSPVHAPMGMAMLAIDLVGADLPADRARTGVARGSRGAALRRRPPRAHVFRPLGLDVRDASSQLGIYLATVTRTSSPTGCWRPGTLRPAGARAPVD